VEDGGDGTKEIVWRKIHKKVSEKAKSGGGGGDCQDGEIDLGLDIEGR